jgi:hypothetical protein
MPVLVHHFCLKDLLILVKCDLCLSSWDLVWSSFTSFIIYYNVEVMTIFSLPVIVGHLIRMY